MTSPEFEVYIDQLKSLPLVPVAISLLLIIATIIILTRKSSLFAKSQHQFLILGPKGSGKTNLFSLLTKGELPKLTVTSIEPNHADLKLDFDGQHLVGDYGIYDFPSSPKLKSLHLFPYLKNNLKSIKGIVYIVDSSNFNPKYCHDVAAELIDILEITESIPNGVDLGIFCNKCDLFTSKKTTKIRSMLEDQVSTLYSLRLKSLSRVSKEGDEDSESTATGLVDDESLSSSFKNGKFEFSLLEGNIDFVDGNLFKGKYESAVNWIHEKAVN